MSSVLVSGKVWLASISKIELTKTLGLKIIILFVQIKHENMKFKKSPFKTVFGQGGNDNMQQQL